MQFVHDTELPVKICICVMILLGAVLDIIVWKYRKYASMIIYYELIQQCIIAFLPLNWGDMANLTEALLTLQIFMQFSCNMGPNIIASTLALTFIQLCPQKIIFSENVDFLWIVGKLFNTLFIFVICCIAGMIVTYIAQIRGKMSLLMKENLNLLNKMHEGIIVVSEKDKSLQFASQPAVHLLNQQPLPEHDFVLDKNEKEIKIDQDFLSKRIFNNYEVAIDQTINNLRAKREAEDKFSLASIVK